MKREIKVSLITVTFNSEKTLADTIESVINQDYSNIEYIIIDGKSEDTTVDIIKKYIGRFPIRWISEPDEGLYDAMNKGIKMATGDIVGIINSDDFYHRKDAISEVAKEFDDDMVDCVFADVRFVHPKNLKKTIRYYSSRKFYPEKFRRGFMPAHPTFFIRKEYFERYGYYKTDYKIASDYEMLMRLLFKYKLRYKYLPIDLMKMRLGGLSTKSLRSNYIMNKEIVRACRENGVKTNLGILFMKYFVKVFELVDTKN